MSSLTRIVPWSQQLACEVLAPGDSALDLTAGKGRDTFALAQAVGLEGQVVAFDLQDVALNETTEFLWSHGLTANTWPADRCLPKRAGIYLVHGCHGELGQVLKHPVKAVVANLGYLPGGDREVVTQPATTLSALQQCLDLLQPGGRLAVTVYPSHPGGAEEGAAVDAFFTALPQSSWQVLLLRVVNLDEAPYLLVAERRCE